MVGPRRTHSKGRNRSSTRSSLNKKGNRLEKGGYALGVMKTRVGSIPNPIETSQTKRELYTKRTCKVCGNPFILGPADPDVVVCPIYGYEAITKSMKQEGWWWVDKSGKKWTKSFDGSLTEVNENKTYL